MAIMQASSKIAIMPDGVYQRGLSGFAGTKRLKTAAGTTEHVVEPNVEETEHVNDGVPEKPCNGISSSCAVPQEPLLTVSCVGEKANEKSTGAGVPVLTVAIEVQFVISWNASIEPNPVAKSYPAAAVYPIWVVVAVQGALNGT